MQIEIHHTYCGCDCGCCGHQIEVYPDDNDNRCYQSFDFDHPDDGADYTEFARNIAESFLKEYHPDLLDLVNWDAMIVDVASHSKCYL